MLKFIVVSDIHLMPKEETTYGIATRDRLIECIAHVNAQHSDADFVVVAGDVAERGATDVYNDFLTLCGGFDMPVHITLGNHDDPTLYRGAASTLVTKTAATDHIVDAGGYRVLVLDTAEPSAKSAGQLSETQIAFAREALLGSAGRPVIVVLHHNIAALHTLSDRIILRDSAAFIDLLKEHGDVRQVISGHVHMTTSGCIHGIPFCTLGGLHYAIDPVLESASGQDFSVVPRREGPSQIAVVLGTSDSVVVHFENVLDAHRRLTDEEMGWSVK